jgi:hypothetical protein
MVRSVLCMYCRYLRPGLPKTCDAYPERIPAQFLQGEKNHIAPAEGDHGIQFELNEAIPEDCKRIALRIIEAEKEQVAGQKAS